LFDSIRRARGDRVREFFALVQHSRESGCWEEALAGVVDLVDAIFSPDDPDGEAGLRLQRLAGLGMFGGLTGAA
jgi:hypothetical protein